MICPFCQQWNPGGAGRCAFCDNDLAAAEDATAGRAKAYTTTDPKVSTVPQAPAPPPSGGITLSFRTIETIATVIFILIVILVTYFGC